MKYKFTYSNMDILLADPDNPLPEAKRKYMIDRVKRGFHNLQFAQTPTYDDWEIVSDALNMMESLVDMGWAKDPDGLIEDAVRALAVAGTRSLQKNVAIRLDGEGIKTVAGLLEDFETAVNELSARTMLSCHRRTEKRVQDILAKRCETHDVQVTL